MHLSTSILKRILHGSNKVSPKTKIVLACMPKTASTFLQNVIAKISGFSTRELCVGHLRNEQDLSLPALADTAFMNIVTHMHIRATDENVKLMQAMRIRPTVLVRNIFDIVTSMRDHCVKQTTEWPMVYLDTSYRDMDKAAQYDMIIDLCIPWFIYFYVSWYKVAEAKTLDTNWLSYEDIMADKPGGILRLCQHYGIDTSLQDVAKAIAAVEGDRTLSNFNKGQKGRGVSELTEAQQQRLVQFTRYYPTVDFSRIGIA